MSKVYTAQEMRDFASDINQYGLVGACMGRSGNRDGNTIAAMLRQAAEMRERCEKRINELGKCTAYDELHGGICPACSGDEVNLLNCRDETCPNGSIIEELKALLHRCDAEKEER